jgi:signal transduction histidine kinase/class 3 adenylate cyclase
MSAKAKNKPKILLVDDEASNLELLHRTLYRDYEVFQASNGLQALEILAQDQEIAVIVSDQRMPLMSGTELLSVTATQYPDIIRIILTAYTDVEDLVEAINSGKVFKYVTKPWKTDELRTLVSQAVDTHNVLKARTTELCRTLRQESLLNAVINTIRSRTSEAEILQTIVETVGQIFDVSYCILRPLHDGRLADEWFLYQSKKDKPIEMRGKRKEEKAREPEPPDALPSSSRGARLAPSPKSSQSEIPDSLLAQTLWETADILVINDVVSDDHFQEMSPEVAQRRQTYAAANIRSSLIVPLMFRIDLLAVLALHQCGQPRIWKDDEVQLGFMVADQASLSLSQVRAYEQVQALAKREALINTITTSIRSSLNPKDIFAAITQQLGEALQVDGCALSLWTENDEYVQCVGLYEKGGSSVVRSEGDHPPDAILNQGETPSMEATAPLRSLPRSVVPISGNPVHQQLLATQEPVVIKDLQDMPELKMLDILVDMDHTQEQFLSPSRALLVVPLLSDGKIIGSISLRHHHTPRRWQPSEIDLAQAVAAQAAIAVQQSRLYQTTRQQAERLLELDRLKTEFFQNISHEFRTPLTLTIGPLESAVQHQKNLPLEQAEIALRNCRRLLRLVNQLLNLQRLDAGRMQPTFRPCNFIEFVEQTVDTFRPYCERKGLYLETRISYCPPLYLDLEKFDKVLYNLLSNAMKFTTPPGRINVCVEQSGNYCMLRVIDTGIGIRNDQIPHLFERFRQAEGSVSRSYEGSGLGLALAKELVQLHGGQITVESVYEKGSTFTVWLPIGCSHLPPEQIIEVPTGVMPSRVDVELADLEVETEIDNPDEYLKILEAESSAEESITVSASLGDAPAQSFTNLQVKRHPLILMVDDNCDLRHYVAVILKEQQYLTILARNGAEGFQMAQKYQPDLIVADLMMPLVSGLDLIRMVRESENLKGIPVILLTAKVDEDTRVEGVEQGADAYLGKPFNDRELLALVHNLLALKENERRVKELNSYLTESVLKRFLPSGMVQKAARGELQLDLTPEPRLITILFSDIVGFTQMSNNLRSRRVAEILNEYLDAMTQAVFEHSGTVDKFVGDAIIAIFGAPEECTPNEQVTNALAAARKMQRSLIQLNEKWQAQGLPEVKFRCGIHQGTAVVGMFGNAERSDYTAIGPSVNIAARLQEASEPNRILVSAAVADYLNDDEIIKYQPLKLKGIDETVLTFLVKN